MKLVRKPQDRSLDRIADMYSDGLSLRQIAKRTGKTHQAVASILQARDVEMRPCAAKGRRPKDQVIYYKAQRYTWSTKGYWRCTTASDRHNLARRIWEENHGPIPRGHEVFYKDGNRFNIEVENLGCLSRSDRQKQRFEDQNYRDIMKCCAAYARLSRTINEHSNPDLSRERACKAWQTRRARYGSSGGNMAGADHPRYQVTVSEETRTRMRESRMEFVRTKTPKGRRFYGTGI